MLVSFGKIAHSKTSLFFWLAAFSSIVIVTFILFPLIEMVSQSSLDSLVETISDRDVVYSIWLSICTSGTAALIALLFGTPFAYLLDRRQFYGKKFLETVIDLPIMIPHPVVGIAILSIAGRNHWLGKTMQQIGIEIMRTFTGLVVVLTFVGLPFYVNIAKAGFEAIPKRLENVSRSMGATIAETFFRVTLPLGWRSMVVGMIMCTARAVSEFGAVVIVAHHPMVAPVMIYERFTAYGLKYSQPVAVWLNFVCLFLFLRLRFFFDPNEENRMIQIQNLQVRFTGFALENISLTVKNGEFFALIGPTGAGKTLILESIAGLVTLSGGRIRIGGRDTTHLPPEKRKVASFTRISNQGVYSDVAVDVSNLQFQSILTTSKLHTIDHIIGHRVFFKRCAEEYPLHLKDRRITPANCCLLCTASFTE